MRGTLLPILTLLLFCGSLPADPKPTPEQKLAGDLIASDQWESALATKNDQVTAALCDEMLSQGRVLRTKGDFAEASKAYKIAETIADRIQSKSCLLQAIRGTGIVLSVQGDNAGALEHYEKSLALAKELGNKTLIAACLRSLGIYYLETGSDE